MKVQTKNKLSKHIPQEAQKFMRISKKNYRNLHQHIGIYHYSVTMLEKFFKLKRTKNEIKNKLEQLRALDNKIPINVILSKKKVLGVDTWEDYIEFPEQQIHKIERHYGLKPWNVSFDYSENGIKQKKQVLPFQKKKVMAHADYETVFTNYKEIESWFQ